MAAVTICSDFGAPQNKVRQFPLFPHLFAMKWWDQIPWSLLFECWVLSQLFTLLFHFHHEALSSFYLSSLRMGSFVYLRLLIFLPEILIPACASSSPAFLTMYSAYMLNKQGDNIQPWCIPFPIWNRSVVPGPVQTVASWPAYRFLKRKVKWSDIPASKNFPRFVVIHTVKGFGIVNKIEIDVFLELCCFFVDLTDVGNLLSGSSPFLNPAWTSESAPFTYCWSLAWRILNNSLLPCERNAIVR